MMVTINDFKICPRCHIGNLIKIDHPYGDKYFINFIDSKTETIINNDAGMIVEAYICDKCKTLEFKVPNSNIKNL